MKTIRKVVSAVCLTLWACSTPAQEPGVKSDYGKVRVGIYDSRAIAMAFGGSDAFNASLGKQLAEIKRQHEKAKADGNQQRVAELEAQGKAQQMLLHRQGFSTAPVDDILKHIKDKIPGIAKAAGVGPIISKWDKDALAKYKAAELVDVTDALVKAFGPTERQLKAAKDIRKHDPIPLAQVENIEK